MAQINQTTLLSGSTTDGTKTAFDVRNQTVSSAYAQSVGGTTASVQFEGTADPAGLGGFAPLAMRQPGGGAYATTAVAVAAGTGKSFFFDPADNLCWIRVVQSATTGSALTVVLTGEM